MNVNGKVATEIVEWHLETVNWQLKLGVGVFH